MKGEFIMGDLSINNLGLKSMLGLSNSELTIEKTKTSAKIGAEFQPKRQTSQQKLEGMLKESPLDDRVPTKKSMSKMGFKEAYIDYTKGNVYKDEGGNSITVGNWKAGQESGISGATKVTFKGKNGITHVVYYDTDGNPVKGSITKESTGVAGTTGLEIYDYNYDIGGNPVFKQSLATN